MNKFSMSLFAVLILFFVCGQVCAVVVWSDGMSSLNWSEDSDATNEPGPGSGGIRVVGDHVQMNSWWDDAVFTDMWRSTGVVIQDESDYTLTVRMVSYSGGTPVIIKLTNATLGWASIVSDIPGVSTSSFTDYSVSFSTAGSVNDGLIGDEIGIGITPGTWNNMAVTNVSIDATGTAAGIDTTSPDPDPMTWKVPPFAKNSTSIVMTARTATDDFNNVEYFFECSTDSNFNSSWQSLTTYMCYGLTTGSPYTFRVKARDTSSNLNETVWSGSASATPAAQTINYPPILPGTGGDLSTASASQLTVTIDVNDQKQTVEGFGASDCWSGQYVGQWPSAKREGIADLLFETGLDGSNNPKGSGLSIWRMNVGGGSVRQNNIYDPWRQSDCYLNAALTGYDWTRCPGQRNFLQLAKARGVEHFTAFSNSPLFTMTKNGYAFCDPGVGATNLDPTKRGEFSVYLADVLEHFRDFEGIDFKTISAINEPEWDWNEDGSNPGYAWQEGCRYSNYEMKELVNVLYAELQSRSIATRIDLCDSGQIDYLYTNGSSIGDHIYQFFDVGSSNYVGDKLPGTISSHSYWTDTVGSGLVSKRQSLKAELEVYGLDYGQSEYCILGSYGPGRDLGIDPALYIARTIHYDMTLVDTTSWQWWLGVSPYDYKDGLVYCDKNNSNGNYYDSKMLWAVGNYARFIRPGMKRVATTRSDGAAPADNTEGLMVSSYYNLFNDFVVTVFVNRANQNKRVDLNYLNLPSGKEINYAVGYVTSSTGDLTAYNALSGEETINVPLKSIVTIVSMHVIPGDSEPDGDVDGDDLLNMAGQWLQTGAGLTADIAPDPVDGTVNVLDLGKLSKHWLEGVTF